MSNILALDSSTDACSVALSVNGVISSRFEITAQSHTQRLLPMVDELLAEQQLTLKDLDALAFGRGPGSFTGLRICMGVVQGLAYGTGLPVIPVSTLEAMAMGFYRQNPQVNLPVLAALDARMAEVYWALYAPGDKGIPRPITDEFVMPPENLLAQLARMDQSSLIGIGAGWHYPAMPDNLAATIDITRSPRAEDMVLLAARRYDAGQVESIDNVQPVYLRDSISWQKRQRIRTNPVQANESE
jgi:tRNA threonylcarbamoyladenosine biosynthesis protein TsaB